MILRYFEIIIYFHNLLQNLQYFSLIVHWNWIFFHRVFYTIHDFFFGDQLMKFNYWWNSMITGKNDFSCNQLPKFTCISNYFLLFFLQSIDEIWNLFPLPFVKFCDISQQQRGKICFNFLTKFTVSFLYCLSKFAFIPSYFHKVCNTFQQEISEICNIFLAKFPLWFCNLLTTFNIFSPKIMS